MTRTRRLCVLAALVAVATAGSSVAAAEPSSSLSDQELQSYIRDFTATKQFLIAGTFKSFAAASLAAQNIARRAELAYQPRTTLTERGEPTYSRQECEDNGWGYPCYVARGRWDDGAYVSVEPTNAYESMRKGYFVVVVASGNAEEVTESQRALRKLGIASFVKSAPVWMGCMH